ncbi:MAG: dienelactone hydrolase family protein [Rhizobacter sp.]|nr:dienelactone hydrolase family protein [Chlorobiales bacterium]
MLVQTSTVDIPVAGGKAMRLFVASPKPQGENYAGVLFYSDIFQLTPVMLRASVRLAGYGFVVAAPEIYHRLEPAGTAIAFDDAGRERGMSNAMNTSIAEFDADAKATLEYLAAHPQVGKGKLGAAGFCIGGHLAFRAAMNAEVKATVCFYGTGIHNGKLGKDTDAGSLQEAARIKGELLMIFGTADPHVPAEGRLIVEAGLVHADVKHRISLYPAEHAFMRDEGPRFDPESADLAFAEMIALFRNTF